MSSKSGITKLELNFAEVGRLLKSNEVLGYLTQLGQAIANTAGPGHQVQAYRGRSRARVTVRTATPEAMRREAKNHNLARALGAARR